MSEQAVDDLSWQGVVLLTAKELSRWVSDALIDPTTSQDPQARSQMLKAHNYALHCFEAARHAPDECVWLRVASHVSGLQEVDILDRLLDRAGQPFDLQHCNERVA